MSLNPALFSSAKTDWGTPLDFYNRLDAEFHFTVDVCAKPDNAKCQNYFTEEQDGLAQKWEGVAWMNPPYGRDVTLWMRKAVQAAEDGTTIVALVPVRSDARWWQDNVMRASEIRFVKGRLRFEGAKASAPFPVAVVVFLPGHEGPPRVSSYPAKVREN